jgi:hypothetical protein
MSRCYKQETRLELSQSVEGQQFEKLKSWNGTAVQRELEPGSRGIVIVRSRYLEMASGDCNRLRTLVRKSDL